MICTRVAEHGDNIRCMRRACKCEYQNNCVFVVGGENRRRDCSLRLNSFISWWYAPTCSRFFNHSFTQTFFDRLFFRPSFFFTTIATITHKAKIFLLATIFTITVCRNGGGAPGAGASPYSTNALARSRNSNWRPLSTPL